MAGLSHVGVVAGLLLLGRRHFGRPIAGLSAAACYLVLPYTRIELVDSGQVLPAALVVWALVWHRRPCWPGLAIGLAAGWMPACVGLLPLWVGFYRGGTRLPVRPGAPGRRGGLRASSATASRRSADGPGRWAPAASPRPACCPALEPPASGSIWSGIDPAYRLPVLIAYLLFVAVDLVWPLGRTSAS